MLNYVFLAILSISITTGLASPTNNPSYSQFLTSTIQGLPNGIDGSYTINPAASYSSSGKDILVSYAGNPSPMGTSVVEFHVSPDGTLEETIIVQGWDTAYKILPDGTVQVTALDPFDSTVYLGWEPTTISNWGISWGTGGGFGPLYPTIAPSVLAQAAQLNIGLSFESGRWTPTQQ